MRWYLVSLVGVTLSIVAGHALADEVSGTRFDLTERSHVAEVVVDRGYATLTVTRVVSNVGPKSDQAEFHIELPQGAVATRLRTAGTNANGETIWFEGELLEAEEAARRYKELTGIGGYYPKDPALLSWRSQTHLALQVFPVLARSTKRVEYTLRMPLTYAAGVYTAELPRLGTEALPATLRIAARNVADRVEVNGVEVTPATPITAAKPLTIALTPRSASPIDGTLASFGFATERNLIHARISAAPKLSDVPSNAAIVVLLDTSHSMESELASQLGAARAYLAEFPGANVEILTFDRQVRSPFGGPLPTADALSRLYAFAPALGNGSALDEALARADEKLAATKTTNRRILILTDLRTPRTPNPGPFRAARPDERRARSSRDDGVRGAEARTRRR